MADNMIHSQYHEHGYFWNSINNDRPVDAEAFCDWLAPFFTTGVFNGDLQVWATTGMNVLLETGYCHIMGKTRNFIGRTTFTVSVANHSYPRIDSIVIELDVENRQIVAKYIEGQYDGDNPKLTPPVRNPAIYQLVVASIYVRAGATEITQADVTDTRMDESLCGWVASTVTEISFEQIYEQLRAFEYQSKEEFEAWFQTIKNALSGDVAANLLAMTMKNEGDIADLSGSIAPVEGAASSSAYEKEQLLMHENELFRVKQNIAVDDALTVGTNIEKTDVATAIKEVSSYAIKLVPLSEWVLNSGVYENVISVTRVISPMIDLSLSGSTVEGYATEAQEKEFAKLRPTGNYADTDTNTVHIFAKKAVAADFYVLIKGVV